MTDDRETRLDGLLAQPLADISDGGFSGAVLAHVSRRKFFRDALLFAALVLSALALLLFMPVQEFGAAALHISLALAQSPALWLAAGALILTFSVEQFLRE